MLPFHLLPIVVRPESTSKAGQHLVHIDVNSNALNCRAPSIWGGGAPIDTSGKGLV